MKTRVVVVTGASSGIGRAAAEMLAARGDRVVLAARGRAGLAAVAAATGGDVHPVDITDRDALTELAEATVRRYGRIDAWIDTAAVMAYGKFEDLPPEVFDRVVQTDLLGGANVARAALAVFRRQGHGVLVLAGSVVGHITAPYMSAYSVSKWGQRALARTLRQETRDVPGIHVCVVDPGGVDTPIYTSAANFAGRIGRPPPPVDDARRVAAVMVRVADRPRARVSVGLTNNVIQFGFTALPWLYDALVGPGMRLAGLTGRAIGPHDGNVFGPRPVTEGGPARWGRPVVAAAAAAALLAVLGAARRR